MFSMERINLGHHDYLLYLFEDLSKFLFDLVRYVYVKFSDIQANSVERSDCSDRCGGGHIVYCGDSISVTLSYVQDIS